MSRAGTKSVVIPTEVMEKFKNIATRNDLTVKAVVLYAMACVFPEDFPELGIA